VLNGPSRVKFIKTLPHLENLQETRCSELPYKPKVEVKRRRVGDHGSQEPCSRTPLQPTARRDCFCNLLIPGIIDRFEAAPSSEVATAPVQASGEISTSKLTSKAQRSNLAGYSDYPSTNG